jgi:hypothetical protein
MRNTNLLLRNNFLFQVAFAGHHKHAHFYQSKEDSKCLSLNLSSRKYFKGQFTAAIGHAPSTSMLKSHQIIVELEVCATMMEFMSYSIKIVTEIE